MALAILRNKVVALVLGPAGLGLLGIYTAVVQTGGTIFSLGLGNSGTREIAAALARPRRDGVASLVVTLRHVTAALGVITALGVIVTAKPLALLILNDELYSSSFSILAVGIAAWVASQGRTAVLTGFGQVHQLALVKASSAVVGTVIGVAAVLFIRDEGLPFVAIAVPLALLIFSGRYVRALPYARGGLQLRSVRVSNLVTLGAAVMGSSVLTGLTTLTARTLMVDRLGLEAVGLFQAAWAVSVTYVGIILSALSVDYYPKLAAIISNEPAAMRAVTEQLQVTILMVAPVLILLLALAKPLLTILYSSNFVPAVPLLQLHLIGNLFKVIAWCLGFVLMAQVRPGAVVGAEVVRNCAYLLVLVITLPRVGLLAPGVAFLVSYFLQLLFYFGFTTRVVGAKAALNAGGLWLGFLIASVTISVADWAASPVGQGGLYLGVCIIILWSAKKLFGLFGGKSELIAELRRRKTPASHDGITGGQGEGTNGVERKRAERS